MARDERMIATVSRMVASSGSYDRTTDGCRRRRTCRKIL